MYTRYLHANLKCSVDLLPHTHTPPPAAAASHQLLIAQPKQSPKGQPENFLV